MKPCIFFDRDGIVNKRLVDDYVKEPSEFQFIPEFLEFFKYISHSKFLKIVITNQQGVGKKLMSQKDLEDIHKFMQDKLLELTSSNFDDIYYCADLANSGSKRRKPEPGMLLEAIEKWDIDTSKSWMIGDSKSDILAGQRVNLNTIFVSEENFTEADLNNMELPTLHFTNHKELLQNKKEINFPGFHNVLD